MKWKPDLSTGWEKMINAARWDIKHNPFGTFTTKGADPDFNLLRCNILIKCLEEYYMKEILKEEVGRSLRSRGMALSLILGGIVSAAQVIQYQIPKYQWNMTRDLGAYPILYPSSVADSWIAGSPVYLENFLYFLIIPILAVLPFGISYFSDQSSGFLKGLYTRTSRKDYLTAKYIAAFVSGGLAVLLPLVLNLLCAMALLPNLAPQSVFSNNGICAANLFYRLYFSHPVIYIILFLGIDFVMGGIWACVALACSFLSDYKIVVAVCPFFLQLGIHVICTMLNGLDYSSVYFIQSGYGMKNAIVPAVYVILGLVASWIIFRKKGGGEDIF